MRIYVLRTVSENCETLYDGLVTNGHDVTIERFDDRPYERHGELVDRATELNPDLIVFIGAPGVWHVLPIPDWNVLRALDSIAPMVLLCGDAADHPWWPILQDYIDQGCFTLYVAIDGSTTSPIGRIPNGMALLTPIDPSKFSPKPWGQKTIKFGMVGGEGHTERGRIREELCRRGLLYFVKNTHLRPYNEYVAYMCDMKVIWNNPMTGSGELRHVKGRVVETGYAGACLLERVNSPTRYWFEPGVHYLEYETVDDIERILRDTPDEKFQAIAEHHTARVFREHHPRVFWEKVFARTKELRHVGK